MKFTKHLPTKKGEQFVAVWSYSDSVWSDTFRVDYRSGGYFVYTPNGDDLDFADFLPWKHGYECKFVVIK